MSLELIVHQPIPGHFYWMRLKQEESSDSPGAVAYACGPLRSHGVAVTEGIAALQYYRDACLTVSPLPYGIRFNPPAGLSPQQFNSRALAHYKKERAYGSP